MVLPGTHQHRGGGACPVSIRDGRLTALRGSGVPSLDEAALDVLRRAEPMPRPLASMTAAGLELVFRLPLRPAQNRL